MKPWKTASAMYEPRDARLSFRLDPQWSGYGPILSQRGLTAGTKLEDWVDYAIRSDCAPYSLAQFDNLAQKTRLSRLVVQGTSREPKTGPDPADPPSVLSLISPCLPKQLGMVSSELPPRLSTWKTIPPPPENVASVLTFTAFFQDIPALSILWLSPFHLAKNGPGSMNLNPAKASNQTLWDVAASELQVTAVLVGDKNLLKDINDPPEG
jgi:hypothetical protein